MMQIIFKITELPSFLSSILRDRVSLCATLVIKSNKNDL